jgi:hypothetical protein
LWFAISPLFTGAVRDLIFVLLTIASFVLFAVIAWAAEKL